jgi:hypothetical protein
VTLGPGAGFWDGVLGRGFGTGLWGAALLGGPASTYDRARLALAMAREIKDNPRLERDVRVMLRPQ